MNEQQELLNNLQKEFVKQVTLQESIIKAWAIEVLQLPEEIRAQLDLPADLSMQSLLPELYKEFPKQEIYDKQFEELLKLSKRVEDLINEYNQRGMECIREFQALS